MTAAEKLWWFALAIYLFMAGAALMKIGGWEWLVKRDVYPVAHRDGYCLTFFVGRQWSDLSPREERQAIFGIFTTPRTLHQLGFKREA